VDELLRDPSKDLIDGIILERAVVNENRSDSAAVERLLDPEFLVLDTAGSARPFPLSLLVAVVVR